jgi:hypothetical protein
MRTSRGRRAGLLSEPGRGFCQYLTFFVQTRVLPQQPIAFLAFVTGQAVDAQTVIQRDLLDPLANGHARGLRLMRQLAEVAAGAHRFHDSPPLFYRVWPMSLWHLGPFSLFAPNTLCECESTSLSFLVDLSLAIHLSSIIIL